MLWLLQWGASMCLPCDQTFYPEIFSNHAFYQSSTVTFLFSKKMALWTLEQNCVPFRLLRATFVLTLRYKETALTGFLCILPSRIHLLGAQHVLIRSVAFAITCPLQNLLAPC